MNVLAIDTTLGACSAAILMSRELSQPEIHQEYQLMNRGHAEKLMPMINEVQKTSGIEFSDIDRIAVTRGPGTFTGVRIGVATARGLALGIGCKTFATTSLHVLAKKSLNTLGNSADGKNIVVAVDAHRGEIYLQSFNSMAEPISDASAMTPDDAIRLINAARTPSIIAGNAIDILDMSVLDMSVLNFKEANISNEADLAPSDDLATQLKKLQPSASDLAELALTADQGELEDHVSPLYLRAPDAKPQTGKSVSRTAREAR